MGIFQVGISKSAEYYYVLEDWGTLFSFSPRTEFNAATIKLISKGLTKGETSVIKTSERVNPGEWFYVTGEDCTVNNRNTIIFNFELTTALGAGKKILVGHGYDEYQASFVELTGTELKLCYNNWGEIQVLKSFEHKLTLAGKVTVIITVKDGETADVSVTASGRSFEQSKLRWAGKRGKAYAFSPDTLLENASLRFDVRAYEEKIWLYGDSYFATNSNARWPYYLVANGYTDFMISGYSGMGTRTALEQFKLDVKYATPEYAVWCMGMNDKDGSAEAPSAEWLSLTEEFIEICKERGITPILATIPSVPLRFNYAKSEWVKNSGYRYIDFEKAVGGERCDRELIDGETNITGAYWYDDMLSSDKVHPERAGAEALYNQAILDFPELLGGKN